MSARRLVANLDCEAEWTGAALPAAVRARIAALGTLMRALATSDDDELVTVAPVDAARVPDGAGAPRPRLAAGPPRPDPGHPTLTWGATAAAPATPDPTAAGDDVAARLWRAPAPGLGAAAVEIARACNDRRLAAAVAAALDAALPGAAIVTDADGDDALDDAIRAAAAASPLGAWVAKAVICAAGRDRVRRRGADLDPPTRTRLHRLRARGGALVVEPWLDRALDHGQTGVVGDGGDVTLWPAHRLWCDDGGGFRGVVIDPRDEAVTPHREALAAAARAAGEAIARAGHRGAFGVDALVHRTPRGLALRPLVEINARMTFGVIARAWLERVGSAGALEVGRGAPPPDARPLLSPEPGGDDTAAWLTPAVTARAT